MSKTKVNPYLAFPGNCREAMNFYKNSLEGELEILEFEDSPMEVPEQHKNKILHSKLEFGESIIMASDIMPGQNVNFGDSMSIAVSAESEENGEKYFSKLSEGGKVIMPFEDAFWGAKFGMLQDKFGVRWMVDCTKTDSASE